MKKLPMSGWPAREIVAACRFTWPMVFAAVGLFGCGSDEFSATGLEIQAEAPEPISFKSEEIAVGLKDEPYRAELSIRGGSPPYQFVLIDGELPPGLSIDSTTGVIDGRPAFSGQFQFTLRATDTRDSAITQRFSIVIGESQASESEADAQATRAIQLAPPEAAAPDIARGSDLSNLLTLVAAMPEGSWQRINLNAFSAVWTPADLRPLFGLGNPTPSKIILAWSSFAWDSNRAALILYGGGHANYRGNDVYLWRASTQMWERGSLPSEMVQDSLGNWNAVDGFDKAPASAHTYDNNIFLPVADRMLVFGGAADSNGGHYLTKATDTTSRKTGVYLFDPSRADPNKVGGTTGSHVKRVAPHPEILGGNMWSNRESWLNSTSASTPPGEAFVNACTGYANEGGLDVVYVRTANRVYRFQLGALDNASSDRWSTVGRFYYAGSGSQASCGYDTTRKVFLSINTNTKPFVAWNLATASPQNSDILVTPTDPSGEFATLLANNSILLRNCGLEYDPNRSNFKLWCGDGRVWTITPPAVISGNGWTIVKAATPVGAVPTEDIGTGILGKWKYVPNLDVFMGLLDPVQGNIWIYKPTGWVNPAGGNLSPSVWIVNPADNTTVTVGSDVSVTANALDGDGTVTKVEFFVGTTKIGESLQAPYGTVWANVPSGTWSLTAVATDNDNATKTSSPVILNVTAQPANAPPTVSITKPTDGTSVTLGAAVTLEAFASDSDGTVARVEFFDGATKLGEATSSPYSIVWSNAPLGGHTLTARATDNLGAVTTSAPVGLQVNPSTGGDVTVTLQRGLTPGSRVEDTYLSSYHPTLNFGSTTSTQDQAGYYSTMLRFAIFQSEGGPVPDSAQITSAVLSIYKYSSYNMVYELHRLLVDWSEIGANWTQTGTGPAWSVAGGNGVGSDYRATADATASTGFDPAWINFDVTSSVMQFQAAPATANFGWRLKGASGYTTALKRFYSCDFAATPTLRPKLVITYH